MMQVNKPRITFHSDGTANVTQESPFSGSLNTLVMKLTKEQYNHWIDDGVVIQHALPHLSADEREFLMTGITSAEWDKSFGEPS